MFFFSITYEVILVEISSFSLLLVLFFSSFFPLESTCLPSSFAYKEKNKGRKEKEKKGNEGRRHYGCLLQ